MRILVVEDEKLLCDGIAEDLELEKYTVERCYDGSRAYELLSEESFDLLILDLNLPGMDGLDLLRAIREDQPELRVLILSARAALSDRVAGLDLGADDYLAKPFALEELEARVRSLLRREDGPHRRRVDAGHPLPHSFHRGNAAGTDPPGVRHFGASDAPPGPLGQSGGADGPRAGIGRQPLQQCGPDAHLLPAEKTAEGPGPRPHPDQGGTGLPSDGG